MGILNFMGGGGPGGGGGEGENSIPLGFIRIFILLICLTSCGSK